MVSELVEICDIPAVPDDLADASARLPAARLARCPSLFCFLGGVTLSTSLPSFSAGCGVPEVRTLSASMRSPRATSSD
eukprot:14938912-Alexandrium_andersonii.AAC.1